MNQARGWVLHPAESAASCPQEKRIDVRQRRKRQSAVHGISNHANDGECSGRRTRSKDGVETHAKLLSNWGDVQWIVLKQGLSMATAGAIAGLLGAWVLRRIVAQVVFGISPADPLTFLAAASVLITFAASASYLPARRAAKVDPMVALRDQ